MPPRRFPQRARNRVLVVRRAIKDPRPPQFPPPTAGVRASVDTPYSPPSPPFPPATIGAIGYCEFSGVASQCVKMTAPRC